MPAARAFSLGADFYAERIPPSRQRGIRHTTYERLAEQIVATEAALDQSFTARAGRADGRNPWRDVRGHLRPSPGDTFRIVIAECWDISS